VRGVVIEPVGLVVGLGCAVAVGATVGVGVGADRRGVTGAVDVTTGVDVVETGVGLAVATHPVRRKVTARATRGRLVGWCSPMLGPFLRTTASVPQRLGAQPPAGGRIVRRSTVG
jgi:hypothetical protein